MIRHDWAIVTLQDALQVEPIPVHAVENADLPAAGKGGEIASLDTLPIANMSSRCIRAATPGSTHLDGESSLICATPRRANPEPPFCSCVTVARS
jgi:hypothetical protein